jgi:hypothetical protein
MQLLFLVLMRGFENICEAAMKPLKFNAHRILLKGKQFRKTAPSGVGGDRLVR